MLGDDKVRDFNISRNIGFDAVSPHVGPGWLARRHWLHAHLTCFVLILCVEVWEVNGGSNRQMLFPDRILKFVAPRQTLHMILKAAYFQTWTQA